MTSDYTVKTGPQFDKEFKKLSSRCPSLPSDFDRLKTALLVDLESNLAYKESIFKFQD